MTDERFSKVGFLKTYAFPALFILLIPAVGVWFAGYATERADARVRNATLLDIARDPAISNEDRQSASTFYSSVPFSMICRAEGPEMQRLAHELPKTCSEINQYRWIARLSVASMMMGIAAFLFASFCVAASLASQRFLHYSFVAGWHVLKIAALLQAICQGIVAVLLSYWMTVVWAGSYYPKLIVLTGLGAACVVWLIIKAIFTRLDTGFGVEGMLLTEKAAPRFWAHVRELASRVGTEPPTHIIAGIDDNFFVTENPVVLNDERIEGRTLFVSFSLLKFLEKAEADAILAHELAHFSGDDTTYTKKMTPARARYGQYLGALYAGGALSRPLFYFMRLFWILFQLTLSRMSRQREFRADAVATSMTSAAHAGRALVKTMAYASYRRRVEQALFAKDTQQDEIGIAGRVANGFASYVSSPNLLGDLSTSVFPHPLDDHPRLDARLVAVRAPIIPSHYAKMLLAPVAESWLHDIHGSADLEQQMWSAYEQRFADAHEQALAWRYAPATADERAHVEKFFPVWQAQTKKGDAVLHVTYAGLHFSEWAALVPYGDITTCTVRESFGRKFLTLKLSSPTGKVEIPLHRFGNQAEVLGMFERYLSRHRSAMAHQSNSQDHAA